MNNSHRFLCIYFLTISFFSHAAEEKGYKIIPFNAEKMGHAYSIEYGAHDFIIGGSKGYHIQGYKDDITQVACAGHWKIVKDDKEIALFNKKNVIIVPFNDNDIKNKKTFGISEIIIDAALDSAKKIIFIAYDYPSRKSGIMKYYYDSDIVEYSRFTNDAHCCSLALSPKKDLLCILDNYSCITLQKTNNLASIIKKIDLSCYNQGNYFSCAFNTHNDDIVVADTKGLSIIDSNNNDNITRLQSNGPGSFYEPIIKMRPFTVPGLVAVLVHNGPGNKSYIQYWDIVTRKPIDKTILPDAIYGGNFCFRGDGLELAITSRNDCFAMPVSLEVIKRYILPTLWMKFKMIQEQCGLPRDVLLHCMNVFTAHCSKKNT